MELAEHRKRRKFICGTLEQGAAILGAVAASVLAVGLVGPYIAALTGASHVAPPVLVSVATSALLFALVAAACSMALRGLARRLEDDGYEDERTAIPMDKSDQGVAPWT